MSLLLETIKVKHKKLQNIDFHNERLNRSRHELLGLSDEVDLEKYIKIPENVEDSTYKCRILYAQNIEKIEFLPYQIKPIEKLQLVEANHLGYAYKFADRSAFTSLMTVESNTDILIIKNGFVTDTSYANVVFFDGKNWLTPSTPLLKGTKRSKLLREQVIFEEEIKVADIQKFKYAKIINAMIDLEESPVIAIESISFFNIKKITTSDFE